MKKKLLPRDGLTGERMMELCGNELLRIDGGIAALSEILRRLAADYDGLNAESIQFEIETLMTRKLEISNDYLIAADLNSKEEDAEEAAVVAHSAKSRK